ncbi:TPA: hypothetical protein EYP66_06605, partial [Candidatus Poribacteria bacterium]|nr:hypothetical protein [Candidatus Poribacteria bacterium]
MPNPVNMPPIAPDNAPMEKLITIVHSDRYLHCRYAAGSMSATNEKAAIRPFFAMSPLNLKPNAVAENMAGKKPYTIPKTRWLKAFPVIFAIEAP